MTCMIVFVDHSVDIKIFRNGRINKLLMTFLIHTRQTRSEKCRDAHQDTDNLGSHNILPVILLIHIKLL